MDTQSTFVLVSSAFVTSVISGTIGMGGGILLMAVMAQYFSLAVLVPLHGLVQLSSNSSRVLYSFRYFDRSIVIQYAIGAVVGVALGSQVTVSIEESWYKIGLACFILSITFLPKPKFFYNFPGKWFGVGTIASFLGLIVGAVGPLIASFYVTEGLKKEALVATKAACQVFTHLMKVAAFFIMGFSIGPYALVLAMMIAAVFIGNYVGKLLLNRVSEVLFMRLFKLTILLLCVRMMVMGVKAL